MHRQLASFVQVQLNRLSSQVNTFMARLRVTFQYYSSWNHFKEIFVIPYRKKSKGSAKLTLHKSGSKTKSEVVIDDKSVKAKVTATAKGSSAADTVKTDTQHLSGVKAKSSSKQLKEVPPTSPAREVEEYLFKEVYFTHSKEPRSVRPSVLKFRVGEVVKHKLDNYHGVIVGWDPVAKVMIDDQDVALLVS